MPVVSPWVLLAAMMAFTGSVLGSYFYGHHEGANAEMAKQAAVETIRREVQDAAQMAAATEISKIKIVNQTNKQVLEREIRTVPDYSRCLNSDDGMLAINAALANHGSKPAGDLVVPGANPTH